MPLAEFQMWSSYYSQEPLGQWRDNYHSAMLCSILYNVNRGKSPAKGVDDFIFKTPQQASQMKTQKTLATLRAMATEK